MNWRVEMNIDTHSHFWPKSFLEAMHSGKEYFGWKPKKVGDKLAISLGDVTLTFPVPKVDLDDLDARFKARNEYQPISMEALQIVGFLWCQHLEADDALKYATLVNDELADVQAKRPDRFRGMGMVPIQSVEFAEREIKRLKNELGITSLAMPTSYRGENSDEGNLLKIIEIAAKEDMSMSFHATYLNPVGNDRFPRYYFMNSFGAPAETSLSLMSLIYSGFFDRFPEARIQFMQGGGCVPYSVMRFTQRYNERDDCRVMDHPPHEYLSKIYFDCLTHDDLSLRLLIGRAGIDKIMIGTDYPFKSDHPGGASNWIRNGVLEKSEIDKVAYQNAARFLRLPKELLPNS
jgi:aminocarboxymuconate-semialdehyde decarboxylase